MFYGSDVYCKYNNVFKRTCLISKVVSEYNKNSVITCGKIFFLCGRVFNKRIMGKAAFVNLHDFSGGIQLYFAANKLKQDYYKVISYLLLGDIIGVKGTVFVTKTGEISLYIFWIEFLAKNLNLFPDKHKGLLDKEVCYRYRYLDLMVNQKTRDIFEFRSRLIFELRKFFFRNGYLEVETPIMQYIPGGATAKPFITYHNYLDSNLYLRVSPELYLKRLIVGGFDKIFELSKNFRNEGLSNIHNPEFTMVEFYKAYSNYKKLMVFTERMFKFLSIKLLGCKKFFYQDIELDFANKFKRLSFRDALIKYNNNLCSNIINNKFKLLTILDKIGLSCSQDMSLGELQFKLFEETVEKKLLEPTFILYHPKDISPLARSTNNDTSVTERFELYIAGKEIANGFSELNDPQDQLERFKRQATKKGGKDVKNFYDTDYIKALEYGLPPTAGEGIGIDRLVMLFTNSSSIKDVLLFPLMKSK